jgi:hypothetical protein
LGFGFLGCGSPTSPLGKTLLVMSPIVTFHLEFPV